MTKLEADKIVERLKNGFGYGNNMTVGVMAEYHKSLGNLEYQQLDKAITQLIKQDSKNVPVISVLLKAYNDNKPNVALIHNETFCYVCENNGIVLCKESKTFGNQTIPYDYACYCCYCDIGRASKYDGTIVKENKNTSYTPCITDMLDIDEITELREHNRNKHKLTQGQIDSMRLQLNKMGCVMPKIVAFVEGDAYEGDDNSCPF